MGPVIYYSIHPCLARDNNTYSLSLLFHSIIR